MLTDPLCLITNHRLLRSTMSDGRDKESCKRCRSGNRSSIWVSTVASGNGRNFLRGGSTVGSTGSLEIDDAGRLPRFLFRGIDERSATMEGADLLTRPAGWRGTWSPRERGEAH